MERALSKSTQNTRLPIRWLPMAKYELVADDKIEQRARTNRQAVGSQILDMQVPHQHPHQQQVRGERKCSRWLS
jgi:hypothetical protein